MKIQWETVLQRCDSFLTFLFNSKGRYNKIILCAMASSTAATNRFHNRVAIVTGGASGNLTYKLLLNFMLNLISC